MTRCNEARQGEEQLAGRNKNQTSQPGCSNPAMPVPDNLAENRADETENSSPVCYANVPGLREAFTQPAVWPELLTAPETETNAGQGNLGQEMDDNPAGK